MPGFNWREGQGQVPGRAIGGEAAADAAAEGGDWWTQLPPGSRHTIVNKLSDVLKKHHPFSGEEGLQDLDETAVRFEESIFTTATSQTDYLRKISLKVMGVETKSKLRVNFLQNNNASTSRNSQDLDSWSWIGSASGGDWQEEIYQKIKSMHEMYCPELNRMCEQIAAKLEQHDALPLQLWNEQLEKQRFLKIMMERIIMFLRTNKNDIQPNYEEKIVGIEKQIIHILNANRARTRRPVSSLQQGQVTQPHTHDMQQSQQEQPQMSQTRTNEANLWLHHWVRMDANDARLG